MVDVMHFTPSTVPQEAVAAIRPAFEKTESDDAEYWIKRCREDTAQLWANNGYWIISEVINGRSGRVLHLVASAGRFNQELIDEVEKWGVSVECKKVIATVRKGFLRRRAGYRITRVSVEKEL